LDNGRWTASEKSFRKALEFDPEYPLGKSLVGRITRNLEERKGLLRELRIARESLKKDEQLLFEVYLLSVESYNKRDEGIKATVDFRAKRKKVAESNFRKFIAKYPNDDYVKAEYIEWLHMIHGPRVALDSLLHLATKEQLNLGFYISYHASLELELGNIERAIILSRQLNQLMLDSTYTSNLKLKAEILMAQDSLNKAKQLVDEILRIDPNHLIAIGMQSEIKEKLNLNRSSATRN
jgi:tetratricopeptide (TPR) repeat protein